MKLFSATLHIIVCLLSTVCTALGQTVIMNESFDNQAAPEMPANWTGGIGWTTSSSSSSPGSGGNNLAHTGSTPGSTSLPSLDFSLFKSVTLSYSARRTSSYDQDNLELLASTDGGTTFSATVISSGQALPTATSSYATISAALPTVVIGKPSVILRFAAQGGTSSGSNIRIDDLVITGVLDDGPSTGIDSTAAPSLFGFSEDFSAALERTTELLIPMSLATVDTLRGFQFDVTLPSSGLSLFGVAPGIALSDSTTWTVQWNTLETVTRVVVLSTDVALLVPGVYDPIVSLVLRTDSLVNSSTVSAKILLSGVIGSFPQDSSLMNLLTTDITQHQLNISQRKAVFQVDQDEFDLGFVPADSIARMIIRLSNASGTKELLISSIMASNPLFTIEPASLTILPSAIDSITVQFAPTKTRFGRQIANLLLVHDGNQPGRTTLSLTGRGTGGRGDANNDGMVNVGDVLDGVDAVLGIRTLTLSSRSSLDVFPQFDGDLSLDVRDLGILVEAILTRAWSDDIPVPADEFESTSAPLAHSVQNRGNAHHGLWMEFEQISPLAYHLWMRVGEPVRGLEISIPSVSWAVFSTAFFTPQVGLQESSLSVPGLPGIKHHIDPRTGSLRLLLALSSDNALPTGRYLLGRMKLETRDTRPQFGFATAYDQNLARLDVYNSPVSTSTDVPTSAGIQSVILEFPYPNPWKIGGLEGIRVPFTTSSGLPPRFAVYDMLGRLVRTPNAKMSESQWHWSPKANDLAPGLYFIQMQTAANTQTRSFSVIR